MDGRLVRLHFGGRALEHDPTTISDHDIAGKVQRPAMPMRMPTRR